MKRFRPQGRRARPVAIAFGLAALWIASAAPAQVRLPGQEKAPEAEAEEALPPAEALAQERAALAAELEAIRATLQEGQADPEALERLALLERLDRSLASRQEALARLESLAASRHDIGTDGPIGSDPPYPFAVYEATSQALQMHRKQIALLEERAKTQREEVERRVARLEAVERDRRRAKEQAETESDPIEAARQAEAVRRLELESRVARAALERARAELELIQREAEVQAGQTALLEATVERLRPNLAITRFDLDEPLHRLALAEEETRERIERARAELEAAERRLGDVQRRIDGLDTTPPELRAELEARRMERQAAQTRIAAAEARLDQLEIERATWERRLRALAGAPRETVATWYEETEQEIDRLRRAERLQASHRQELVEASRALEAQLETAEGPAAPWLAEQLEAAETLAAVHASAVADAAATRAFLDRARADFRPRAGLDATGELRSLLSRARKAWDREVFVVDDRSITLGKIVLATLLFVLAFSISRIISQLLGRLLLRRMLEPGAATAFESLVFYGLLVAFLLLALRTVNIPLTAFALVGGALAIGVGFGSQNVINNFISGLILLVERPIKTGDIVDVDGVAGVIERVGPRSTRVRTFDNLHIIVPNSAFLERNVINWTLSDLTVRRNVTVGVAYGSDPRETSRLILRAIDEHGRVLKNPEPKVFFWEFGDNALLFKAYFWLQLHPSASFWETESDLRHRIHHLLRDARITIAFPQRDVHLDSVRPIEVRMVSPDPPA